MKTMLVALCLLASSRVAFAQTDVTAWRQDLAYLAAELPRLHRNLFDHMTRAEFEAAIERLDARIPSLDPAAINVELARLVAMVQDGHTRLVETSGPAMLGWHRYAVRFALFGDGLFIESAAPEHAALVGSRVQRIGSMTAERAIEAVAPFVPRDNPMTLRSRVPGYLALAEVLHAAGATPDASNVTLALLRRDGAAATIQLPAIDVSAVPRWATMRDAAATPAPLSATNAGNTYWFHYLADRRTMYVQFNAVADKQDEKLDAFWDRVFAVVDREPVERFVLDLRQNGGGDNTLNLPLVHHLIRSGKINERGKLFVLIGRRTFSAATALAVDLEKHTQAVFVGEPTGGHPNHYTDVGRLVLPRSGLRISYSPSFFDYSFPGDRRVWVAPDVAVEATSDDVLAGRDSVFDAAAGYVVEQPLADRLIAAHAVGGLQAAMGELQAFRRDPIHKYADVEWHLHLFGRRLVARNQFADATRVFELNVLDHPDSFRVYEDLGLLLARSGDRARASATLLKSLELNPANTDAADALEQLASRPAKGQ